MPIHILFVATSRLPVATCYCRCQDANEQKVQPTIILVDCGLNSRGEENLSRLARISDPAAIADRRSPTVPETFGQPSGSVGRPATAREFVFSAAPRRPIAINVFVYDRVFSPSCLLSSFSRYSSVAAFSPPAFLFFYCPAVSQPENPIRVGRCPRVRLQRG